MMHDSNCDWLKYEALEGNIWKTNESTLRPILPDIRNSASPACPSDKSCIKMQKMYLEHWWNDTTKGSRSTRRRASPAASISTIDFT